ncbi:MAG: hypothetical protein WC133_03155 [Candidatus Omnitrophota bacterium]
MDRPGLYFPFMKGDLDGPNLSCASIDRYWDRPARSFLWIFLLVFLLGFSSISQAETAPNVELEGILQKIESRHYRWIAIRADVLLFFAKEGNPNAMCGGELLYQRLDERMLLTCVDARHEVMFVFRTLDRRFDLYLPAQNTVYHGSIFDLEDSPDIESHLKARDLYRALKPMAVDARRTKVERTNSAITSLDVYGRNKDSGTLMRKLYLTPEGDVRGELFYDSTGRPVTEIQRYDFQKLKARVGAYDSIIFPKKITITSPETKKGSAIFFTKVAALDSVDPLDFILRIPPGTKEIFLNERDPRFQALKAAPTTPAPSAKEMPVYLAKPLKISATKKKPAPAPKEAPKIQEPAAALEAVPVVVKAPENIAAAVALNDQSPEGPSPASNDQTTLDPSVDPSMDMGKQ